MRTASLRGLSALTLQYSIGINQLDVGPDYSFRELEFAVLADGTSLPVAHGRCVLVQVRPKADPFELLDAAAEESDEYHELSDVIAGRCAEGLQTFDHGPVLALQYIELRRALRGTGQGAMLGLAVLRLLCARFRVSVVIWKPYPLQYLDHSTQELRAVRGELIEATKRLSNHYQDVWGATRLASSGWLGWVPPFKPFSVQANKTRWWLGDPN
ncbi:hypothetical protein AS149_14805 [Burkholderia cenocepacia]|nr:hypothetical protein AS149_14805 [Burkholderia cenocepacia]